jgi:hypothetical protein
VGKAGAVRVAKGHVLGPGVDGGAQALERVRAVLAPRVEEVLGVVHDPLAPGGEEGDRVADHRQVLLPRDAGDLLEVERPRLADQGADRCEA